MRVVGLVLLVGCGRIGFGGVASGDDASSANDGTTVDTPTVCAAFGPWGAPARVMGISGQDPARQGDGLQAWATLDGNYNIYRYERTAPDGAFGAPVAENALNGAMNDQDAAPTADGLDMLFVSDRSGQFRVYEATRATSADLFGAPQLALGLEAETFRSVDVSGDGLVAYFERASELFRAERTTRTTAFAAPVRVATGVESFVSVSANELEMYYADSTTETLYIRDRATRADGWTIETPLVLPTNPQGHDVDISADGSELWFFFNNVIYAAKRPCL